MIAPRGYQKKNIYIYIYSDKLNVPGFEPWPLVATGVGGWFGRYQRHYLIVTFRWR